MFEDVQTEHEDPADPHPVTSSQALASPRPAPAPGDLMILGFGGLFGYLFGGDILSVVLLPVVALVVFLTARLSVPLVARRMERNHSSPVATVTGVGAAIYIAALGLAVVAMLTMNIGMGVVVAVGTFLGWRYYARRRRALSMRVLDPAGIGLDGADSTGSDTT